MILLVKKKLYLLTTEFPYGKGEKPFIIPELEYLKKEFEITIISSASSSSRFYTSTVTALDDDIRVIWYECNKMSSLEKIRYSMQAFFSPAFIFDMWNVIKSRKCIVQRIAYSLQFYSYSLRMYKWLKTNITEEMIEDSVVYSFWYYVPAMAAAMLKGKYGNFKLVSRAHGFDLYNERVLGGRQPFRNYIDTHLERVFFIAEIGYDYYLNNICKKDKEEKTENFDKYRICRMGVKSAKLSMKSSDGIIRIVSCSSVIPLKRINLIIEALSKISDIKIYWTHFGDGTQFEEMKKFAFQKIGGMDNIRYEFAGNTSNKAIRDYYGDNPTDLFITTSETEGCPVSIQEAMAAGIPIIGTAVGEIPLMIQENGYILPANPKSEEIVDKIRQYSNQNLEEIQKMRNASFDLWDEKYNSDKNYPQLLKELMKL